jgi:3-oxoacyl-[acyl-carrier-protein] synthase II
MNAVARLRVVGLGLTAPGRHRPDEALLPQVEPSPGWFDTAALLPGRGYRRLPPGCLYLLAAARAALADTGPWFAALPAESRAAVIGANNVGAALQHDFDRTVIDVGAAGLSPALVPYMALSMYASRLAPEHGLRAFALATNSPAVAGLEALQTAARALAAGRASALLVGAVEDRPAPAQGGGTVHDLGAAVLACVAEDASASGAPEYGHCSVRRAFVGARGEVDDALAPLWEGLVGDGRPPARVDAVLDDSPAGDAVGVWLAKRAGDAEVATVVRAPGGGCLTPVRQVVGHLATGAAERVAVVAVSAHGQVSIADVQPNPATAHGG